MKPPQSFLLFLISASLVFAPHTATADMGGHLYLVPNFEEISTADQALGLIQCAFTKGDMLIEISDSTMPSFPRVELTETQGLVAIKLKFSEKEATDLGRYPPSLLDSDACHDLLAAYAKHRDSPLAALAPSKDAPTSLARETSLPGKAPNFLQRNWPYFAVAVAVIATGIVLAGSLHQPAAASAAARESRGYTVR